MISYQWALMLATKKHSQRNSIFHVEATLGIGIKSINELNKINSQQGEVVTAIIKVINYFNKKEYHGPAGIIKEMLGMKKNKMMEKYFCRKDSIHNIATLFNFMRKFAKNYDNNMNTAGLINDQKKLEITTEWRNKLYKGIPITEAEEISQIIAVNTYEKDTWGEALFLSINILTKLLKDRNNEEYDENIEGNKYFINEILRTSEKITTQIVNRDINKELWNRMNEIKEKQMITTTIVNISYLVKELAVSIMILNIKLQNMNEKIANKRIFKSIIGLMYNRMNTTVKKKIIEDIKQKVERKVKKQKEYKEFQGYLKINQDENLGVDYKEINTLNKEIKQVSEDKRYNQNSNNDYKINRQQEQQRTNRFRNNNGFNRFNKATTKTNKWL
ncbi:hypothetical protein RFI_31722 [Reticulomyxa filosa]|uniref:Uncharacterized protein n=1 Tax=Reticulomyxa filosa TaxID=46433 RepID=X6LUR0_RETFI|nr:hypothetical protein RFI_31722 [Reticulomyxa filosa]|eukprot:ETO05673.1 hypothetical protein RFI_31722 [Reticulomyxa filosa]